MRRFLDRLFRRGPRIEARVTFDAEGVTCTLPNGTTETVRWEDLREVTIVTTDEGPFADDVTWMLLGTAGGCAVPGATDGMKELLSRLQQLPGFDHLAVVRAMGSAVNATFVCWKRDW